MEQQLIARDEATNRDIFPVSTSAGRRNNGMRTSLPVSKTMVYGAAGHLEDRAADSELISGGTRSRYVWFVRSGILRLQRYGYSGRRQLLSLFFPGEIVGFETEFREGVSLETATDCGLCRIERRSFDSLVNQTDDLRAELFRQKQDQLDRLHWLTWSLGALRPDERLCAFFALSSKFMPFQPLPDGTGVLSLSLPRKDIADLLGTTVESISRSVHKLADVGVIEIKDPAHFRFLDLSRLIALGKIDGLFERMTIGLARRRERLESLVAPDPEASACFCGH